jgi:CBS domain-containing protein
MTRQLITLRDDEPVGDLEKWMERLRFHHLPVIDANMKLVGLITRADFLHAMLDGVNGAKADANTPAGLIMRKLIVTAKPDYALTEAARVMLKEKLSCLPVVVDDATLVGILTNTDFAKLALAFLEL